MLIGAHVSPAGGPAKAVERGREKGCQAIQIFNQSPRAWRARVYTDDEVAAYREALKGSRIDALLIHAVYLLNCASEDKELRDKSLRALVVALRAGDALGAHGVVLHPGSAKAGKVGPAIKRAGKVIEKALAESERCPLHLENTAGAGGTLGRSFGELAELLDAAGGDRRLGICLDSCHLYASGFDVRTADGLAAVLDDCGAQVGLDRLGSLHFNDSQVGLGSNRDRHALIGSGELGAAGAQVWFSEPRFESLPCVLETPGVGTDKSANEVARAKELRTRGRRARSRRR
jgi:deoxyribonuclease-4